MTSLDSTFSALADATRRAIVARLLQGEATVGELAQPFAVSLHAISRHLKVLEGAGLIHNQRRGKYRVCRLNPNGLEGAAAWIEFHCNFWNGSFDRLAVRLKEQEGEAP